MNDPKLAPHFVKLCLECLLDCFQARRVEVGNYELDEVGGYRGTLLAGIGLRQEGRYGRKLGDEMGIQMGLPRKR